MLEFDILVENLFIVLHKRVLKDRYTFKKVFEDLFVDVGKLVMAERVFIATFFDDMRRDTYCSRTVGDLFDDDGVGTDFCFDADGDVTQDFGTRTDNGTALDRRVAFPGNEADTAQSDPLVDDDVVFDNRRFTDDDTGAVVDEDPAADGSTGVDIDIGQKLAEAHQNTCGTFEVASVEGIGDPVPGNGPDARIVEKEFDARMDGGIVSINVYKIFFDISEKSQKIPLIIILFRSRETGIRPRFQAVSG